MPPVPRRRTTVWLLVLLSAWGCSDAPAEGAGTKGSAGDARAEPPNTSRALMPDALNADTLPPDAHTAAPDPDTALLLPFGPTGNRLSAGSLALATATREELVLPALARWVVGTATDGAVIWLVALEDGRVARVSDGAVELLPEPWDVGRPLVAQRVSGRWAPVAVPAGATPGATPALVSGELRWVTVGDVALLPDARLLQGSLGLMALGTPTTAYPHGVLGDAVEAAELVALSPGLDVVGRAAVERGVIEGLAPIGADLDPARPGLEWVVTVSNAETGARLVAYDQDLRWLAEGPAIATGFRWRHAIAVAPFAPDGVPELAVVKTPHLGGVVEFYRVAGDALTLTSTVSPYGSHTLGSRNLEMALAADLSGDGRPDLLLPTQDQQALAVVSRDADGATQQRVEPLPGALSSNVAAVTVGASLALAAGVGERLVVWR